MCVWQPHNPHLTTCIPGVLYPHGGGCASLTFILLSLTLTFHDATHGAVVATVVPEQQFVQRVRESFYRTLQSARRFHRCYSLPTGDTQTARHIVNLLFECFPVHATPFHSQPLSTRATRKRTRRPKRLRPGRRSSVPFLLAEVEQFLQWVRFGRWWSLVAPCATPLATVDSGGYVGGVRVVDVWFSARFAYGNAFNARGLWVSGHEGASMRGCCCGRKSLRVPISMISENCWESQARSPYNSHPTGAICMGLSESFLYSLDF